MGRPKALLPFGDLPLLARVADQLAQVCDPVLLVARQPDAYAEFGLPVVVDHFDTPGPPSGVHAGLTAMPGEWGVVVACDLPFLSPAVLRYLVGLRGDWDAVVPRVDGFLQPLHAVYHRRLAAHLATLLVAGGGQLKELLTRPELRVRLVEEAELRPLDPRLTSFMNLNAPADYERALRLLSRTRRTLGSSSGPRSAQRIALSSWSRSE